MQWCNQGKRAAPLDPVNLTKSPGSLIFKHFCTLEYRYFICVSAGKQHVGNLINEREEKGSEIKEDGNVNRKHLSKLNLIRHSSAEPRAYVSTSSTLLLGT